MKLRNGFVSNSSSSSFLIYGLYTGETADLPKNQWEEIECQGLSSYSPEGCNGTYFGLSWDSIGDSETGAQFKQRVKDTIEKYFPGKSGKCTTHSEAWYS
jgi:hypothetical protein